MVPKPMKPLKFDCKSVLCNSTINWVLILQNNVKDLDQSNKSKVTLTQCRFEMLISRNVDRLMATDRWMDDLRHFQQYFSLIRTMEG